MRSCFRLGFFDYPLLQGAKNPTIPLLFPVEPIPPEIPRRYDVYVMATKDGFLRGFVSELGFHSASRLPWRTVAPSTLARDLQSDGTLLADCVVSVQFSLSSPMASSSLYVATCANINILSPHHQALNAKPSNSPYQSFHPELKDLI